MRIPGSLAADSLAAEHVNYSPKQRIAVRCYHKGGWTMSLKSNEFELVGAWTRLCERTYPQGEMQGGGPPRLRVLSEEEARQKYEF